MSFGFGLSDFVTVSALAVRVVGKYRSAPSEYRNLCNEVSKLSVALEDIVGALRRLSVNHKCYLERSKEECEALLVDVEQFLEEHEDVMRKGKGNMGDRVMWMTSEQGEILERVKNHNDELHKASSRLILLLTAELHHEMTNNRAGLNNPTSVTISATHYYTNERLQTQQQLSTKQQQLLPYSKGEQTGKGDWRRSLDLEKPQSRKLNAGGPPSPFHDDSKPQDPRLHRADTDETLVGIESPMPTNTPTFPPTLTSPRLPSRVSTSPRLPSRASTSSSSTSASTSSQPRKTSGSSTASGASKKSSFFRDLAENFGQSPSLQEGGSSAAGYRAPPAEKGKKSPPAQPKPMGKKSTVREKEPKKSWKESFNVAKNLGGSSIAWDEVG